MHRRTEAGFVTEGKVRAARHLLACGHPVQAVAGRTGLTAYAVTVLRNVEGGEPDHDGRGTPLSPERRKAIVAAILQGCTISQITKSCHCSETTLYKIRCQLRQSNSTALLPCMAPEAE